MNKVVLWFALVVGLGAGVWLWSRNAEGQAKLRKQAAPMKAEIEECRSRLASFYKGWSSYRKAHKGAEPPSVESMIPRYIKNPELLLCPTGERLTKQNKGFERGMIEWKGTRYPVTYGFRWLTPASAIQTRRMGDAAPLIVCATHREAIGRYVYSKDPSEFVATAERQKELVAAGATGQDLVLRRNGKIDYFAE